MKYLKYLKESIDIPDELIDNFQEIEDSTGLELLWIDLRFNHNGGWTVKGNAIYQLRIYDITPDAFETILNLEKRLQSFKIAHINYSYKEKESDKFDRKVFDTSIKKLRKKFSERQISYIEFIFKSL